MICVSPLLRLNAHVQVEQPHIHQVTWSVLCISSRRCNVRKAAIHLAQNRINHSMVTAVSGADRRIYEKTERLFCCFWRRATCQSAPLKELAKSASKYILGAIGTPV